MKLVLNFWTVSENPYHSYKNLLIADTNCVEISAQIARRLQSVFFSGETHRDENRSVQELSYESLVAIFCSDIESYSRERDL